MLHWKWENWIRWKQGASQVLLTHNLRDCKIALCCSHGWKDLHIHQPVLPAQATNSALLPDREWRAPSQQGWGCSQSSAGSRHILNQQCLAPGWADRGINLGWALLDTDRSCWDQVGPLAENSSFHHHGLFAGLFCQLCNVQGLWCTFPTVLYLATISSYFYSKRGAIFSSILHFKNIINKHKLFLLLFF